MLEMFLAFGIQMFGKLFHAFKPNLTAGRGQAKNPPLIAPRKAAGASVSLKLDRNDGAADGDPKSLNADNSQVESKSGVLA